MRPSATLSHGNPGCAAGRCGSGTAAVSAGTGRNSHAAKPARSSASTIRTRGPGASSLGRRGQRRPVLLGVVRPSCHEHRPGRQHRRVNLLLFKLTLTPLAIGVATLAGRRFGPALGGWVAGISFTSAPVAIFLALDRGSAFATVAASGILAAAASQAAFALLYSVAATRVRWPLALAAGAAGFVA